MILVAVFVAVLGTSTCFIIDHHKESNKQAALYDELAELVNAATQTDAATEPLERILELFKVGKHRTVGHMVSIDDKIVGRLLHIAILLHIGTTIVGVFLIKAVLKLENTELTQVLSCRSEQSLSVVVNLALGQSFKIESTRLSKVFC